MHELLTHIFTKTFLGAMPLLSYGSLPSVVGHSPTPVRTMVDHGSGLPGTPCRRTVSYHTLCFFKLFTISNLCFILSVVDHIFLGSRIA